MKLLILTVFIGTSLLHGQAATSPIDLNINVNHAKSPVSPTLYGLMTEEINYSYDGGLYGELIRNRTFQSDWSGILNWFLIEKGSSSARISVDRNEGPSAAIHNSAKLEVVKANTGSLAGLLNEGYWGIAVRPNTRYTGSLFAKSSETAVPLNIALVADESGQTLAQTSVPLSGTGWREYKFEMQSGNASASAENHLELTISRPATVWLQMVSLFPPTYHNRPNGNRIDLMEKLAAMHPSFLRFPGGNYLEGNRIDTRFDWKKMIGPIVDRPTHPTTWGYNSSDGMGVLEFLEWCEDLRMEPVLAVYAGYSLGGQVAKPGPDLQPYVQDALDEIEYVTGATDTKWGAVRARDGHAAPFPLRYIEVGNEDSFDRAKTYDGRFAQFFTGIKAKYPKLQIIATIPVNGTTPDVVDDHYYKREQGMFELTKHYDNADRKGPKIFIGEWATREGTPTPNFGGALGDAAFMTSMERNSDLVVMSAYRATVRERKPGRYAVGFRPDRLRRPEQLWFAGYYAQAMFSSCLGDHTVDSLSQARMTSSFTPRRSPRTKKLCLKLVNAASTVQPLSLNLSGLGNAAHTARLVTLSANSVWATHTIRDIRIASCRSSSPVTIDGKHLNHNMPAYSIQVLELDLGK